MHGHLRLGDEWKAITVIARSQPNPLKAVAELVENAIDAHADRVVILRGRHLETSFLSVVDNGRGLPLDPSGEPDFHHVATHICDSLKHGLPAPERRRVQGEFGIGLLGFWTLGRTLRMVARNQDGQAREMVMHEGEQSYSVGRPRQPELIQGQGVEVTVSHLHPTTRHQLTGEKIRRFLSIELRDRIRQHGIQVEILDRIARKELLVVPHRFAGERVARVHRIQVPGFGVAHAELYYNASGSATTADRPGPESTASPDVHRVWLARNGTRVADDLGRVPGLERKPWTSNVFEGVIDFPALTPSPGSRHGVVQDAAYAALVKELDAVADELEDLRARRAREQPARVNRRVARTVRRVLHDALKAVPGDEYESLRVESEARPEPPLVEAAREEAGLEPHQDAEGGPLQRARIQPVLPYIPVGRTRSAIVVAEDEHGRPARGEFTCTWEILEGPATIARTEGFRAWFQGREPGRFQGRVRIQEGEQTVTVLFRGTVVEATRVANRPGTLPSYELVPDPGASWRSRYAPDRNAILINSNHPDFVWSQSHSRSQLRYLTMLYLKELIVHNFADASPQEWLDRFVELGSRLEMA